MYEGFENDYGTPIDTEGCVAIYQQLENPPIRWQTHEVLKEGGIGVLYGPSGSMKSYGAVTWACRVRNGMDLFGRPMKQGNVLYICGEAAEETYERIEAWLEYYGKSEGPFIVPWAIQIHDVEQMQDLKTMVKRIGDVRMVIFDNLADCSVGVKLSDPDDVGERLKPAVLSFVKETKAAMLMLHHTGHDQSHERGAKVLRDMADTTIKATKASNMFDLEWKLQKVRRLPEGQVINLHIEDVSDTVGIDNAAVIRGGKRSETKIVDLETGEILDGKVAEPKPMTATERLQVYLAEQGGRASAKDVQTHFGWIKSNGKANGTYYDAINGSDRVVKDGSDLVLVPNASELDRDHDAA